MIPVHRSGASDQSREHPPNAGRGGKAFHSKVGRRIFGLFIISALLPIVTLAVLTFVEMRTATETITRQRAHEEAKSAGMNLLFTLSRLESDLRSFAAEESQGNAIATRTDSKTGKWFRALALQNSGERTVWLQGQPVPLPFMSEPDRRHVRNGGVLLITRSENETARLYVAARAEGKSDSSAILLGEVDAEQLLAEIRGEDSFAGCLLTAELLTVACDADVPTAVLGRLRQLAPSATSQPVSWRSGGSRWAGAYWMLFTQQRYRLPGLAVLWASDTTDFAGLFERFRALFPPMLALTLLLCVAISLHLIRRSLVPLERLQDATRAIAAGRFDSRVSVRSGDEFEDLAHSFNRMAVNLDGQFRLLKTLSEVDRMILSVLDADKIVQTLITRIPEVTDCQGIGVLLLDGHRVRSAHWAVNGVVCANDAFVPDIDSAEYELLAQCRDVLVCDADDPVAGSALTLVRAGMQRLARIPVRHHDQLIGIVCLGYRDPGACTDDVLARARTLADRAAVAFSNAAWEEKLYVQAHYDALTALPNRQLFLARLDEALANAARHNHYVGLLFIDIDRFKSINDSLGHQVGDEFLMQTAQAMQRCVRMQDLLVRLGGDEFTVIVPELKHRSHALEITQQIAERLRVTVAQPFNIGERSIALSASIGIALFPDDASDRAELMRSSDTAMYHAKSRGRNNWQYYSAQLNATALERLELASMMSGALERGEFEVYMHPQVDCRSGALRGAEALLRWRHPVLGMIPPSKFIPIAEQTGLIVALGEWVLDAACRFLHRSDFLDRGNITLAVNVSVLQLQQRDYVDRVAATLARYSVPAGALELEVTENICVDDVGTVSAIFRRLRSLGIKLAIDDFGTGYSSMNYLRHLGVDTIKIDSSFVRDIPGEPFSCAISDAITRMAHSLNCKVLAEGVETEAQLVHLQQLGCDNAQGYHFARPMPLEEFERWCRLHHPLSSTNMPAVAAG